MTSDEIKEARAAEHSTNTWLKEVAYQLALLNEKEPVTSIPQLMEPVNRKKVQ
jgi:hypothetical protein